LQQAPKINCIRT